MTFLRLTLLLCLLLSCWANAEQQNLTSQAQKLDTNALTEHLIETINKDIQQYSERHHWSNVISKIKVQLPAAAASLPVCPTTFIIASQDNQSQPVGRLKRQVKCESPTVNWRLNATVYVQLTLPVMVARTLIHRDELITRDMLDSQMLQLKAPKNIITDADQVIGLHTIRRIRQGQLITENLLKKPFLINKGDQVLIVAKKGKFEASTKGMALEHGKMHEQIKVENTATQKVIHARVFAQGKVETIF
ncbi:MULTISPECIES: flagellar basal body P-ring formation chaperone FlgA [unclassified Photobacterium]|uniref:flagellar basal body P-ring formation chaperone FlgA n=1 Tax=unclassified Photobacterium TaxID=2628852 RepID=UPI001EDF5D37|nr:flagellar basal body P-ring formation protein FlgA [Photobacterium sp. Ph6]MCG3875486.1 flagellar basal body P-ring formation protein FlgA [Photobacterium sp. Ph5]